MHTYVYKCTYIHTYIHMYINVYIWFLVWVLRHINHCRLFNAKDTFVQIVSSFLNNSV